VAVAEVVFNYPGLNEPSRLLIPFHSESLNWENHSEPFLIGHHDVHGLVDTVMARWGISDYQIPVLYTERSPCTDCRINIDSQPRLDGTEVLYHQDWGIQRGSFSAWLRRQFRRMQAAQNPSVEPQ
jgi:hypothetical protein